MRINNGKSSFCISRQLQIKYNHRLAAIEMKFIIRTDVTLMFYFYRKWYSWKLYNIMQWLFIYTYIYVYHNMFYKHTPSIS